MQIFSGLKVNFSITFLVTTVLSSDCILIVLEAFKISLSLSQDSELTSLRHSTEISDFLKAVRML